MKKITLATFLIMTITTPVVSLAETFPPFPMAFWGNVTINGVPAPIGSVLKAYSGGYIVGQVVIQEPGIYGYTEPIKQKLLIGQASGPITFSIQNPSLNNGAEIFGNDSEVFISGSTVRKDFSFTFTPQVAISSNGGGGGGAAIITKSTLSEVRHKIDANKDNKIDILDFNILMIQWGNKGIGNVADFNNDGIVDIFDFNLLMVNWTK
jgi:hypothetical protein